MSFGASLLLFAFEPFVGKLLLPKFGGTPLVWNACMAFYQVALLAGYAYAVLLQRVRYPWMQALSHALLLVVIVPLLPGASDVERELRANVASAPLLTLGGWLLRNVFVPFVALSALTTLVHSWYARATTATAASPYRLYAASNAGSLAGLFLYPMLLEPRWSLTEQQQALTLGGAGVAIGVALLAALLWRGRGRDSSPRTALPEAECDASAAPKDSGHDPRRWRTRWWAHVIWLAAVPSALLLGVTNYLLTDVASMPLLWVVPLALYLSTFIVAFGAGLNAHAMLLQRIVTLVVLVATTSLALETTSPAWLIVPLHLLALTLASLLCHVRLAALAPAPARLPRFYLALSAGGAIGGLAALFVPPLLTDRLVEYPVALVLSTTSFVALGTASPAPPPWLPTWRSRLLDVGMPLLLVVVAMTAIRSLALSDASQLMVLAFGPAALFALQANARPTAFTRRLAGMYVASFLVPAMLDDVVFADRTFYGRVRVTYDRARDEYALIHGTTVHGVQRGAEREQCRPTTYYHPMGPAGRVLAQWRPTGTPPRVALIGLGAGALTCYARDGETWDLYELDPVVARVAQDSALFTFLQRSPGTLTTVLGDARLGLRDRQAGIYGVVVIDAFSSDAIPTHLITREALAEYRRVLSPDGLLLVHVSNRFFDLAPALSAVARDAGWTAWRWSDRMPSASDERESKYPSEWIAVAASAHQRPIGEGWRALGAPFTRLWTDEYSNPLGLLRR